MRARRARRLRPTRPARCASRSRTATRSTSSRWTPHRSVGSTTSGRSASAWSCSPSRAASKVYILDEAHQLTDAAWQALLKLIEEPPPHLVFVFCTTELQKVLATVRSRCQTFVFQRPRLPDLVTLLRRVADGEGIQAQDSALSLIARAAHGSFRDAVSTLDQLAASTNNSVDAAVGAPARRRRGRGVAVAALRHGRRPRHGRRAALRRGALGAGAGSGQARPRPPRAPPASARSCSTWATCPTRCR